MRARALAVRSSVTSSHSSRLCASEGSIALTTYRDTIPTLVAICTIATLLVVFILHTLLDVGLYGDGAFFFLQVLSSQDYYGNTPYRNGATYITQSPILLAIGLGERSIATLAALHTVGLMAVPTTCFAATTWITRRNTIAAAANMLVICCCYFMTIFFIIGEFHVLYALFWLCSVLVFFHPHKAMWHFPVLISAGVAMLRSYELTVVTGCLLAFTCAVQSFRPQPSPRRMLWVLVALLFLGGVPFGLDGILEQWGMGKERSFIACLLAIRDNRTLLDLLGILGLAATAAFFRNRLLAISAAAVACYAAWRFSVHAIHMTSLGLGDPYAQRAQVFPVLIGAFLVVALARLPLLESIAQGTWQQWPLLIPLALVLTVYSADVRGWLGYVQAFCAELAESTAGPDRDAAFVTRREVQKFGWPWEFPTMSVLLRDPGNDRTISNQSYYAWYPFFSATAIPDVRPFKQAGGLCRRFMVLSPLSSDHLDAPVYRSAELGR
jgi:hypothetical protein